jgi:GNAT superfamily N-acetyltransferase
MPGEQNLVRTLDIASVEVVPKHQGKGLWATFARHAEELAVEFNIAYVFVESILNPRLAQGLAKHGYLKYDEYSMYKKVL